MGVSASFDLGIHAGVAGCECLKCLPCKCLQLLVAFIVKLADVATEWLAWSIYFQHGLGPLDSPRPTLKWVWLVFVVCATVSGLALCISYLREFCKNDSDADSTVDDHGCSSILVWEYVSGWLQSVILTIIALRIYDVTHECSPSSGKDALLSYTALLVSLTTTLLFSLVSLLAESYLFHTERRGKHKKRAWARFLSSPYLLASLLAFAATVVYIYHLHTYAYGATTTSVWYTQQPNSISHTENIPESVQLATLDDIMDADTGGLHVNYTVSSAKQENQTNHYLFLFHSKKKNVYYSYISMSCNMTDNTCSCSKPFFTDSHLFLGFRDDGDDKVVELYCPEARSKPIYDADVNLACATGAAEPTAPDKETPTTWPRTP